MRNLIKQIVKEELFYSALNPTEMKEFLKLVFMDLNVIMPFETPIIKSGFDTYYIKSVQDIDNLNLMQLQNLYNNIENKLKSMNVRHFHELVKPGSSLTESFNYNDYSSEFYKIIKWLQKNGWKNIHSDNMSSIFKLNDITVNIDYISANDIKDVEDDYVPNILIKKNKKLVKDLDLSLSNLQTFLKTIIDGI